MKYNIKQNWVDSAAIILKKPVILLPFILLAFLEILALEFLYFFPRAPFSFIAGPVVKKFFGEAFLHYPGTLLILPKLFYYAQVLIYIVVGVLLSAISINIFKNIKSSLPLKANAISKNAFRRYLSFFAFGFLMALFIFLLRKSDGFLLSRLFKLASKNNIGFIIKGAPLLTPVFLFLTNIIMQVFFLLALPLMIIQNKALLKALGKSVIMGARNFFTLFTLVFAPYLIYFPISLIKAYGPKIVEATFPEINIYIAVIGTIFALLIECFVIVCASQFLLDKEK